ncbi:hypothetical protein HJG60_012028 [Phyllostomus discolor]|uniref:Uncharacterized protein n=1 Tax=Phyllostomus discolor TaxID=89673 RepID=A0A833ZLN6_9CHIR|nr:hypothetical protein HJG60_012028 [Phyllostomus discolor]
MGVTAPTPPHQAGAQAPAQILREGAKRWSGKSLNFKNRETLLVNTSVPGTKFPSWAGGGIHLMVPQLPLCSCPPSQMGWQCVSRRCCCVWADVQSSPAPRDFEVPQNSSAGRETPSQRCLDTYCFV